MGVISVDPVVLSSLQKSSGLAIGAVGLAAAGIGYWFWSAEKEGQHSGGRLPIISAIAREPS